MGATFARHQSVPLLLWLLFTGLFLLQVLLSAKHVFVQRPMHAVPEPAPATLDFSFTDLFNEWNECERSILAERQRAADVQPLCGQASGLESAEQKGAISTDWTIDFLLQEFAAWSHADHEAKVPVVS